MEYHFHYRYDSEFGLLRSGELHNMAYAIHGVLLLEPDGLCDVSNFDKKEMD